METIHYKKTKYGFEFGSAKIARACSDTKKGWVILTIETPKHKGSKHIQLYVTKTGKVRFITQGKEYKLEKHKKARES